ncbi:chorismate-binding protein [Corynebacterium appendicis]|uniref:chorismate-binding protein n=1 Tax=Corynebacterium appendicis TaxID=163202 RepID=UPI00223C0CE1|nr:chorismate-binding protein [Corynebacterium appendicis]MCT1683531.1 chorismate-binding protein [Corynebacterium appendicis]
MILLVDNHDSYTFNLAHLIAEVAGEEPVVVPADRAISHVDDVAAGKFSHIVISPGPGTPARDADFAGSRAVIEAAVSTPLLGVCLGHQGLAHLAGAEISRAPEPRHGFISRISHSCSGLFQGIPQNFEAVRYHSLHIREPEHAGLIVHARSEDGIIQALEVEGKPHWGVQFHPESVLTQHGQTIMQNFLGLGRLRLVRRTLQATVDCQRVFEAVRRGSVTGTDAFWLDSADASRGRYSILGDTAGPLSRTINYRLGDEPDVLHLLDSDLATGIDAPADLPFSGGWIGYLGFECAQLTLSSAELGRHLSDEPDAYFVRPQSFIVYDHHARVAHLCALDDCENTEELLDRLEAILDVADGGQEEEQDAPSISGSSWRASDYPALIRAAQETLRAGDSYEVCLTDTFTAQAEGELYRHLRAHSPAPYAANLLFGGSEIMSASPERFLKVRGRSVEANPIKGTVAAEEDPCTLLDEKTRAENLMIVDLLRNDLSRVCEPGTVTVPRLMAVESYATVHQLVSTITGELRPGTTLVDLLRATFPPGSMTGAPKPRTCEIIDRLEDGPRGVYSGVLGYLGYDGQADLSVVIRTAVRTGDRLTVGAGGAIVLASDVDAEVAEKQLKADTVLGAFE